MRWTRPDLLNAVRETSRFMSGAVEGHIEALKRIMRYCVSTAERGLMLKPKGMWDGTKNFLFTIEGISDSEYAKDETRRSVNGWSTFLCGAPMSYRSKMMPIVALSVTEAELYSAVLCAQDMLFAMRILNAMQLKVKLPMYLYVDNKGAKELCNNWSVGGRTRHVEVKQYFLRELKEAGLIEVRWVKGSDMTSDVFTKNLARPLFEKHIKRFVGEDVYMKAHEGRVSEVDCREPEEVEVEGRTTDEESREKNNGVNDRSSINNGRTRIECVDTTVKKSKTGESYGEKEEDELIASSWIGWYAVEYGEFVSCRGEQMG